MPPTIVDAPEERHELTELGRGSVALGALAVLVFYALMFALAPTDRPPLMPDSGGYLAVGRWLAGVGELPQQVGPFYSWAYGVPFAVPYLFTSDVGTVHLYGVALNCLAGSALYVLLLRLIRRLMPAAPAARTLVYAGVGAAWSGVSLQVGQIWPEVVLAVLVAAWVLVLVRLLDGERRAVWELALLTVVLFATHHRMIGLAPVAVVVLLVAAAGKRRRVVAAAALLAGLALTLVVDHRVQDVIYPLGPTDFKLVPALDTPSLLFRVLVGELWSAAAATAGVAVLAFWLLRAARGPALASGVVTAAGAVAVLGAAQLTVSEQNGAFRADFFAYGRYLGAFVPVLLALGFAELVERRSTGRVAAAIVTVGGLSVLQLGANGASIQGLVVAPHVAGTLGLTSMGYGLDVLRASILATAAAVTLVAAVLVIRPRLAVTALGAAAVAASVAGATHLDRYLDRDGTETLAAAVDRVPPGVTVKVDAATGGPTFVLLQLERPDRRFVFGDFSAGQSGWVVHDFRWRAPRGVRTRLITPEGGVQLLSCVGSACG